MLRLFIVLLSLLVSTIYLFYSGSGCICSILETSDILIKLRIYKLITAVFVGASLSVAGFVFQKVLNNKLADPYILGVASSSNLFISFALLFLGESVGIYTLQTMSLIGGMFAVILLFAFSRFLARVELVFILIGVSLNFIFSAFNKLLISYADGWQVLRISSFMLGNFDSITFSDIILLVSTFVIVLLVLFLLAPRLEIISTGVVFSESVGLNYGKWSLGFLLLASFLIAVSTSIVGIIPFVGLFVPNLTDILFKNKSIKEQLLLNITFGALFLMFVVSVAGLSSQSVLVPVGAVSSVIGAPLILIVLYRGYRAV